MQSSSSAKTLPGSYSSLSEEELVSNPGSTVRVNTSLNTDLAFIVQGARTIPEVKVHCSHTSCYSNVCKGWVSWNVLHALLARCGQTNMLLYWGVCSLMGSLTVVSIKAVGIAIKLTLEGISQVGYPQTWLFVIVAAASVITQLNYLNKVLDTFYAAIVSKLS